MDCGRHQPHSNMKTINALMCLMGSFRPYALCSCIKYIYIFCHRTILFFGAVLLSHSSLSILHKRRHARRHAPTNALEIELYYSCVRARNWIDSLCNYHFIFRWKCFITISIVPSVSLITRSSSSSSSFQAIFAVVVLGYILDSLKKLFFTRG